MTQLGTLGTCLSLFFVVSSCGSTDHGGNPSSGGSAGSPEGGSSGEDGTGGSGATATVGETGEPPSGTVSSGGSTDHGGSPSSGGSAGSPEGGSSGEDGTAGEPPVDTCVYPESLGGAGDPQRCGVTPGAWYPLGDSDLTTWPERVVWGSASGVGLREWLVPLEQQRRPEVGFASDGRVVVASSYLREVTRWDGQQWEVLDFEPRPGPAESFDMVVDRAGNPILVRGSSVLQWRDGDWVSLHRWSVGASNDQPRIALDVDDHPIVVRPEQSGIARFEVWRWNGSSFEALPQDGNAAREALHWLPTALTVRENGNVVVAWFEQWWTESVEHHTLNVQQFDGERWEPLGDSVTLGPEYIGDDSASAPTLVVDDADQVLVAWSNPNETFIHVWDGTTWLPPEVGLWEPQLVKSPEGTVYLTGRDETGAAIWRRDAGAWVPVAAPDVGSSIELAVGPNESFAAAWVDPPAGDEAHATHFMLNTDGDWRELGERTAQEGGVGSGGLQLVSLEQGLFLQGDCEVYRWDGETWEALELSAWTALGQCANSTLTETAAGQPVLAVWLSKAEQQDECEYDPCVLYNNDLYLLGLSGEGWEELSEPYRKTSWVRPEAGFSVAFDGTGTPFVAWEEIDDAWSEIPASVSDEDDITTQVMAWDGTAWESVFTHTWPEDALRLVALHALPDDQLLLLWDGWHSTLFEGGEWESVPESDSYLGTSLQFGVDAFGTHFLSVDRGERWSSGYIPDGSDLELFELTESGWESVTPDEARLASLPERFRIRAHTEDGEIYLRRFENGRWVGLSASNVGGGVSNSVAHSDDPSFAIHDGTICVSWLERGEHERLTMVRCHD